ncbi:MAG: 3'-5' exonuclease [Anaerolineaceae bacterium]|nr:3'-5' exonuclease [Anaerolineaceae bacterium]
MFSPQNELQRRAQAVAFAKEYLSQQPVYLDTETTGLDSSSEIVEITILDHSGETLLDSLVKPLKPIPADATKIHGISNDMVNTAPTWPVLWPTIRSVLVGKLIGAYNAEFDMRMIQRTHMHYQLPWKENFQDFCIMKLFAQFIGQWDARRKGYRYFRLEQAGKTCKINIPNSHRAIDDTRLARAVHLCMANYKIPPTKDIK